MKLHVPISRIRVALSYGLVIVAVLLIIALAVALARRP
jgi:hypothetical protein